MKIDIVGCYCTWVKELSTSFIINDEILFDVPQGSFKTLLTQYPITDINYIIISHFHSDHFMDIHLVLDYLYHHTNKTITILAPKGCKEKLIKMFQVVEISYLERFLEDKVIFIDAENNKIVKIGDYKIKCYKMLHASLDAYGFTIEKGDETIGFGGDSTECNNLRKIIKKSSFAFIDSSNVKPDNKHLAVKELIELKKEYASTHIVPVHLSYFSRDELTKNNIPFPKQGDIIITK